jgi:hypothetical protein
MSQQMLRQAQTQPEDFTMKLKTLALAVAAVAAAQGAAALTPADIGTADFRLFIGGATAQDPSLKAYMANVCAGNGADLITMSNQTTAPGNAQSAYFCTLDLAEVPGVTDTNGDGTVRVLVYKRSSGGSAYGVAPVLNPSATDTVARLDTSSCPAAPVVVGGNHWQCTGTVNDTPEGGISDVEPSLFTGPNLLVNLPEAPLTSGAPGSVSLVEDGGYSSFSFGASTFGVQVTKELRDELQRAQGLVVGSETEANMPSLSKDQVASLFGGSVPTWDKFYVDSTKFTDFVPAAEKPTSLKINLCRRSPGSGTQAQFNALFFNSPCHSAAAAPLRDNTATTWRVANAQNAGGTVRHDYIGTTTGLTGVPSGAPAVHEGQGAGDVERCMQLLNGSTVTRWGVGFNSLERGSGGSKDYVRFVKIDGVAPTLENVASNKYFDWSGATIQWRTAPYAGGINNVPSANQLALLQSIRDTSITPADVDVANDGYAKPAGSDYLYGNLVFPNTSLGILPNFPFDANDPVMTGQRVAGGKPNTCTPTKIINEAPL